MVRTGRSGRRDRAAPHGRVRPRSHVGIGAGHRDDAVRGLAARRDQRLAQARDRRVHRGRGHARGATSRGLPRVAPDAVLLPRSRLRAARADVRAQRGGPRLGTGPVAVHPGVDPEVLMARPRLRTGRARNQPVPDGPRRWRVRGGGPSAARSTAVRPAVHRSLGVRRGADRASPPSARPVPHPVPGRARDRRSGGDRPLRRSAPAPGAAVELAGALVRAGEPSVGDHRQHERAGSRDGVRSRLGPRS